jgi:flagellar protein FliO/FliZ
MRVRPLYPLLALCPAAATAADGTLPAYSPLHALFGLAIVLGLIFGAAYLLKRVQPARFAGARLLRLVAQMGVGARERVVVVEIGDQWLVLGVTAHSIQTLHTTAKGALPDKPEFIEKTPFSAWLARARGQHDAARSDAPQS